MEIATELGNTHFGLLF